MHSRTIVVFSPGGGHAERLLPLVTGLARRGLDVHVMTRPEAAGRVTTAGGIFHDLFAEYPLEAADSESIPQPCRFVSFAARYVEQLTGDVAALQPALIVYDSFMVVAPLIAQRLGIPWIGMRAGHAQIPGAAMAEAERNPRVVVSAACREAVETLRTKEGLADANPFSYLDGVSPHLNLYPEPPQFIDEPARRAFEPIAFFGSLAPGLREALSTERPLLRRGNATRVYVSFGTAIWRYHAEVALAAMRSLSDVLSDAGVEALFSLGRHEVDPAALEHIRRPNVRVEHFVDQWGALKDADVFVTHHGLNSTHEAVYHRVPMLSYPFFGDQPAMARTCRDLGLSVPLSDAPLAPLDPALIRRGLERLAAEGDVFEAQLSEARRWEIEAVENRETVFDRLMEMA